MLSGMSRPHPQRVRTAALTASSFASMLFLGIGVAIIGAAAPAIGLSTREIGLLQGLQNVGFAAAVIVFGYLADVRSHTRLLIVGCVAMGIGLGLFYAHPSFILNALVMVGIGVGIGVFEAVTDAMLFRLYPNRRSLAISLNHLFVTLGSLAITVYILFLQLDWRSSTLQAAALTLIPGIVYIWYSRRPQTNVGETKAPAPTLGSRLAVLGTEPRILNQFVCMMCAYGMQVTTIGLVPVFLIENRGFSMFAGTMGLVVFVSGIAVGRAFIGWITREASIVRNTTLHFAGATICLAAVYFVPLGSAVYPVLFAGGLMVSGLLPLIITFAGLTYPEFAGLAMGAVKTGIPVGGIAVPLLMSALSGGEAGLAAFLVPPMAGFTGIVLLLVQRYRMSGNAA
ncbi:MAG: MFS transporter [Spirochaetaceae bacterium]